MRSFDWPSSRLGALLCDLDRAYGSIENQSFGDPFEMLLWDKVAYLAGDAKRAVAFRSLRDEVGLTPSSILAASPDLLAKICLMGGTVGFEDRANRIVFAALLVMTEYGGNLSSVLRLPSKVALKELRRFPGVGLPGAETILLTFGALPVLALESNGLRVLTRLGFGKESPNYSKTYNSVRAAVSDQLPADCAMLLRAHHLLRRHGLELCKTSSPICTECPVNHDCPYGSPRRPGDKGVTMRQ